MNDDDEAKFQIKESRKEIIIRKLKNSIFQTYYRLIPSALTSTLFYSLLITLEFFQMTGFSLIGWKTVLQRAARPGWIWKCISGFRAGKNRLILPMLKNILFSHCMMPSRSNGRCVKWNYPAERSWPKGSQSHFQRWIIKSILIRKCRPGKQYYVGFGYAYKQYDPDAISWFSGGQQSSARGSDR